MDAVISWVDGSDPEHRRKRWDHLEDQRHSYPAGCSDTRFFEIGEIYFCAASILKYAPFIRRIWIVTDQQKPRMIDDFFAEGLCDSGKISIIDHKDIFAGRERLLPTFNSLSIESMLWKIPDLDQRYIYLNDDFLLSRPCCEEDFFLGEQPVIYCDVLQQRKTLLKVKVRHALRKLTFRADKNTSNMQAASDLAAQLLDEHRFSYVPRHQPHPMTVSRQANFYAANESLLDKQLSYRFRNKEQFLPVALANMLEIRDWGAGIIKHESVLKYVDAQVLDPTQDLPATLFSGDEKFLCLQSLDQLDEPTRLSFLQELLREYDGFYPSSVGLLAEKEPASCMSLAD